MSEQIIRKPYEVLRHGTRALLAQAIEAEVATFLATHADRVDDAGRRRLVRNGFLPERQIQTGIGPVAVRQPRVRDRGPAAATSGSGSPRRSSPAICAEALTVASLPAPVAAERRVAEEQAGALAGAFEALRAARSPKCASDGGSTLRCCS